MSIVPVVVFTAYFAVDRKYTFRYGLCRALREKGGGDAGLPVYVDLGCSDGVILPEAIMSASGTVVGKA